MKRTKIESKTLQIILRGFVYSKTFLVSSNLQNEDMDLFPDLARQIVKWCVGYFEKYKNAPEKNIESMFFAYSEKDPDSSRVTLLRELLEEIFSIEVESNVSYLLDLLSKYIRKRKLERLKEQLDDAIVQDDMVSGEDAIAKYTNTRIGESEGFDTLNDKKVWSRVFRKVEEPLISFEGQAGDYLNVALQRDCLFAIQGPEKSGKTAWCIEFAVRALMQRRKVALFEVGDLSEAQYMVRLASRFTRRPVREADCGEVRVPKKIVRLESCGEDELGVSIEYVTAKCSRPINQHSIVYAINTLKKSCGLPKDSPYFVSSIHANSSINVAGINRILKRWENDRAFIPDVVIIDYADILAPEDSRLASRDQVNDTWKALRRLSQERHCLVIVPTQSNRVETKWQQMKNVSEDKRKAAHVTALLGLNQMEIEKEAQVQRLNWMFLRDAYFQQSMFLYVGQCRTLQRAITCTTL